MEITKEFEYDLPDDYLSQETTLGLKANWTYVGEDKIWVFVDKETNKLNYFESFSYYDDGKDYEEQLKYMTLAGGLNSYPVLVEAEKEPLLISAIAQKAPEMKDMEVKNYYHYETGEWIYARPNPTTPDHTIELPECEYDPEKSEWKKPFPWKKPHITREEFENWLTGRILYEKKMDISLLTDEEKNIWSEYLEELENIPIKFEKYLDTPWMIKTPDVPIDFSRFT